MSSPSRARLSQERSRQRREQLLEAAIELFTEGGARAVTHRAVAKRSGLPPATTTYYFSSVDELLGAALARHLETWIADMKAMAEVPLLGPMHIDEGRELVTFAFALRTPEMVRTHLAVFLTASGDPELKPLATEAVSTLETLAGTLLASVGIDDAAGLATALVQLVLGSAAMRLTGPQDDEEIADALFDAVRRLVATWGMSPDAVTAALPPAP